VLKGTETWRQAMRKMFDQLALDIINGAIRKILTSWLESITQQVASSQQGATILKALGLQNMITAVGQQKLQSAAQIQDNAAVAGSAAVASTAAIPVVGAEDAPAAGAEAYSQAMAYEALVSEKGAVLKNDALVFAHANETILPAKLSQGIQEMILNPEARGGGGQGGAQVNHYQITAHDAKSFEKYVNQSKNRNTLMNAVKKANMRGNRAAPNLR
jgi:hypothetical protein